MKRMVLALGLTMLAFVSGCATSFTGNAKLDGPVECRQVCGGWGMELAGMVAMGEYTNGCICKVKGEQLSANGIGSAVLLSSVGAAGGTAGVVMQMQENSR